MKKIILVLATVILTCSLLSSCAGTKGGYGCPTGTHSNKPFRS